MPSIQKGESLRNSPFLLSVFFEDLDRLDQITTVIIPGSCGMSVLSPSFPHSPVVTVVVRATSLPIARLVADSLDCHSVTLSFWKIALPLISKRGRVAKAVVAILHSTVEKIR